jgi:hypothetical protein
MFLVDDGWYSSGVSFFQFEKGAVRILKHLAI